ncbi:MAG: efflux RND transporter periplasmic adaptor subunit [Tenuifilaceae bacterium]
MNKFFISLVVITTILLSFSCSKKKQETQGGDRRGRGAINVETVVVKPTTFSQQVTVAGTIHANEIVELKSESTGKLISITFNEGDFVKTGQLLGRINDSEIRARLEKSRLDLKLAEEDEARKKRLLEINALSQQEYDIAQNKLQGIKADIRLAEAQIEKAEIRAPFDGRIGLRYVSPGTFISSNTPVATLVQTDPVKIEFAIAERFGELIRKGKEITFSTTNRPNLITATVYAFEPMIDPQTRSITVRALASNKNGDLIPGAFVKVNIKFDEAPKALLVPPQAVIPELSGQKVFIIKNGKAVESKVIIGLRTGMYIEIISGLESGDSLITTGLIQLRRGMAVKPTIVPFEIE